MGGGNSRLGGARDCAAVLGGGRLELLEEIDRCHSISAAARRIGISYRHAWVMVQEVNRAAGELMVEAATGGRNGGGAQLTPHGRQAVAAFRDLQERLRLSASLLRPRLPPDPAAACVRVAAAVSLEEVLEQLLADYGARRPSVRIRAVFGASDELADQILEGAPADLFLSADPAPVGTPGGSRSDRSANNDAHSGKRLGRHRTGRRLRICTPAG